MVDIKLFYDVYPNALDVRKCIRWVFKFNLGIFDLSNSHSVGRRITLDIGMLRVKVEDLNREPDSRPPRPHNHWWVYSKGRTLMRRQFQREHFVERFDDLREGLEGTVSQPYPISRQRLPGLHKAGISKVELAGRRGCFAASLLHLSLRVHLRPKSVDFQDAENRQHPCRSTIWHEKNPLCLFGLNALGKIKLLSHNGTVNGDRYRAMITYFFIPELNNHDAQELWFQQDGATCHTARATIDLLKDMFGDRLISRFGPVN
ncbi:uncharacterized protein TNCV_4545811 [Trichonephila clavipes]|nr:uncharacterized protein TNCV_4545811 [Trichonephila clavipes]